MSKYERFKQNLIDRCDEHGYIRNDYKLFVDGYLVNYFYIDEDGDDEFIFVDFYCGATLSKNIYEYEVDENNEYRIEWFVLENEDE